MIPPPIFTAVLSVFLAPLVAMSSLAQDVAYWQAAHTWQHQSPITYYTYTVAFLAATLTVVIRRRRLRGGARAGP